ncbi:sensor histidine kinase [Pseudonocardia parietis]|uniref:histidine kinase n=1 Tax=Pseudonocardia parietis TaxID=570936 RepID=A0ABS4W1Z8_9PSEU|nr:sensor histidine kinase [Pseudonocardia parietis]MBP2369699.1 signal transduction histidine kinase [Pseudonocardia parietis]
MAVTVSGAGDDARRARALDVVLSVMTIVLVGVAVSADLGDGVGPGPVAYGFTVGLGGLMLVRRRFPVGVLVTTAVGLLLYYRLGQPPIGLAVPVVAALFSAAEQGRTRWASAVAVVLLVVSTSVRTAQGDDPGLVLGYELPSTAALMAASIACGAAVRARREWHAERRRREVTARWEREREATDRVERERLRIARDLHDLLAHTTAVIALHADVAREALRDDPDTADRSLATVRAACSSITRELRATLGVLRDPAESGGPPPDALRERLAALVDEARLAGTEVSFDASDGLDALPAVTATTTFHVVQEALTNVLRHSPASRVELTVVAGPDQVTIRVADDGGCVAGPGTAGVAGSGTGGWGLIGMRERVELTGGRLSAAPGPRGFVVEATLPVPSVGGAP